MKPLSQFLCIALLSFTSASYAQDVSEPNPKFFKNFLGVTQLLRANGVEPSIVSWSEVEATCTPLNDTKNPTDYNRCRYEKARDQVLSGVDANNCNSQAVATFPDALRTGQPINVVRYIGGKYSTTTITNPPISLADLNASRSAAYDTCMNNKGWRNPHNYLQGHN